VTREDPEEERSSSAEQSRRQRQRQRQNQDQIRTGNTSIQLVTKLQPLVPIIERHDRDLADQLKRASTSVVLNVAEGSGSAKGNRAKHFALARGSANEVRAALRLAVAWRWVDERDTAPELLDEVLAMLWRLTHPRVA
jgi:four helix bundle protein